MRLGCPDLTATLLSFSPPPSIPLPRRTRTYASHNPLHLLASIACTNYPLPPLCACTCSCSHAHPCDMCSELPQVRGVCCLCVTLHCLYTLAGDSISRDCISPASHQATPGSMQPSRPSPLSPHLLNRRGAQSARPPRSAPSVPPSLRVTCHCGGADASPHSAPLLRPRRPGVARLQHYPALCCDAVAAASPSPRRRAAAASPSPRRRAAAARRRRLAVALLLRCVATPPPLRRRRRCYCSSLCVRC